MKLFVITKLIFFWSVIAYGQSAFNINAGASLTKFHLETDQNLSSENEIGSGLVTSINYQYKFLHLGIFSQIFLANFEQLSFKIEQQNLYVNKGSSRNVQFTPFIRINSPYTPLTHWQPYLIFGPTWSVLTFKLKSFSNGGAFDKNHKIVFESFGHSLGIGMQKQLSQTGLDSLFIELIYSKIRSFKLSAVDAKDEKQVEIVSHEETDQLKGYNYFINIGATFF